METIGNNIVRMQTLINTPISPSDWIRNWQMEAEHVLYLAHMAKDRGDIEALRELDVEAAKLVQRQESQNSPPV